MWKKLFDEFTFFHLFSLSLSRFGSQSGKGKHGALILFPPAAPLLPGRRLCPHRPAPRAAASGQQRRRRCKRKSIFLFLLSLFGARRAGRPARDVPTARVHGAGKERCSSDGSEAGHSASDRGRGREKEERATSLYRSQSNFTTSEPQQKTSSFHQKQPAPFSGAYVPRSQDEEAALCLLLAAEEGSDEVRESV